MKIHSDYEQVVLVPDTQWPFQDDDAEQAMLEFIRRTKPSKVIHVGDAVDFYSLSSYRKALAPSERIYLLEEINVARAKFEEYRKAAPRARRILLKGNHDERLDRYLEQEGGELFDLSSDVLAYDKVTGAGAAGWEVIGPYGAGVWAGQPGGLWVTHGDLSRKWSGQSCKAHVMEKYGHSVAHGHTHRLGAFYHTNGTGTQVGIEVGTIASRETTPRATELVDWQYGFVNLYVHRETPEFHFELVHIQDGGFIHAGKAYGG